MEFDIFDYATTREYGDLHLRMDNKTGLSAVIAIHNTNRGPALGGCRCIEYPNTQAAIFDAMRLGRAMSFKSAILGLPLGGGKAVLYKPPEIADRTAYFEAYGRFVEELGGKYITAVDSGTTPEDMDIINSQTRYVTSLSTHGDTSRYTALGVKAGIEAAVRYQLDKDLTDSHICIQGLGNVGFALAKFCAESGARLSVSDTNASRVEKAVRELEASAVAPDAIYSTKCDVFAPCALGAVINETTLPQLNTQIVAGAANNQLKTVEFGKYLHQQNILYAPDYVINAGGLIYAAGRYHQETDATIMAKLSNIDKTLTEIFAHSKMENLSTSQIADQLAHQRLSAINPTC